MQKITLDVTQPTLGALRRWLGSARESQTFDLPDPRAGRLVEALCLQVLAAAETDAAHDAPAGRCRRCGCTDRYGCPEGCGWAEESLCTACVTPGERRGLTRLGA